MKILFHPYLLRRDATHHIVGAIQGVGQGVLVSCLVQLLDNTCTSRQFEKEIKSLNLRRYFAAALNCKLVFII